MQELRENVFRNINLMVSFSFSVSVGESNSFNCNTEFKKTFLNKSVSDPLIIKVNKLLWPLFQISKEIILNMELPVVPVTASSSLQD